MKKLLIATRNKGKLVEINEKLKDFDMEVICLDDVPGMPTDFDIEEPAMTMEGNAIIKAIQYGEKTSLLTLADDSGLEVDYLDGAPGVLSARYAKGTDLDRTEKLLNELLGVPKEERTANFRTVIAIYDPSSKKIRTCEGIVDGGILTEARGAEGFGYDPVFYSFDLKKTFAEAGVIEKNKVSHRARALDGAKELLKNF